MIMKKIIFGIILIASAMTTYAQFDFVTYQLRGSLPQAMELNPSFINNHKVNVNFIVPFFGVHVNANQPFPINSVFKKSGDQYNVNLDKYLKNTAMRTALVSAQVDIPILLVTFDTKIGNFSLGSTLKTNVDFGISNDFLRLAWEGNVGNKKNADIKLKNTGVYANVYLDNFIGFSKSILDDKLRIGGRVHFLVAPPLATQSRIGKANITTDPNTYDIRIRLNDARLYTSGEGVYESFNNGSLDLNSLLAVNYGGAVDLGAEYKLNDQWSFHASVNNIGAIRFNKDVTTHTINNLDTTLSGIDFNKLINGDINISLPNVDATTTKGGAFTQWLPIKMYLGASWQFTKKQRLDGTFALYNIPAIRATIPAIMVGYNAQLGRIFNWAFNVSYNTYTSIALGTGFTFNAGPIQLYLMLDNFLPAFDLSLARSVDARVGLNLNCGYRYKKKKSKDIESKSKESKTETIPMSKAGSDTTTVAPNAQETGTNNVEVEKAPASKKGKDNVEVIDIEKVIKDEKQQNP